MSATEVGSVALALSVLLFAAHALGYLFERFRQPPLVGEILAGILLGPFVLGRLAPGLSAVIFGADGANAAAVKLALHFTYWFGLLLLMFLSGSETRKLMAQENQRPIAWILGVGTPLPFFIVLGLGLASLLPLDALTGPAGNKLSTLLILAIAVAVTSIPVISRIFHDLGILHTRFASLILGSAVIEDILLWGVLAVATALAGLDTAQNRNMISHISSHVGASLLYTVLGLFAAPVALRALHRAKWNFLAARTPVGYVMLIMLAYAAFAAALDVTLVFAAFLAGFGVVGGMSGSERPRFAEALDAVRKTSFGVFIPVYFAMVGYKLAFGGGFSLPMLVIFLLGSSFLSLLAVGLGAKLAGFKGLDIVNLAVATNARGGPGIVLASVAYEQGIINAAFYTTLVLTAVLTSQIAGAWLGFVLSRGWPLLSTDPKDIAIDRADRRRTA